MVIDVQFYKFVYDYLDWFYLVKFKFKFVRLSDTVVRKENEWWERFREDRVWRGR